MQQTNLIGMQIHIAHVCLYKGQMESKFMQCMIIKPDHPTISIFISG
jgi:hypothetical protein